MDSPQQIVLVDDDPVFLTMHKRSLEMLLNVTVVTFTSGLGALRYLSEHPDVALLMVDDGLPSMDGPTMIRTLRHHPRLADLAVLAFTDRIEEQRAALLSAGASSVIDKDQAPLQVAREVQRMLAQSRGQGALKRMAGG